MFKTILVALDGSDYANKALDTACSMAVANDADLHLVHASEFRPLIIGSASALSVPPRDSLRELGEKLLNDAASRVKLSYGGEPKLHNMVVDKPPANSVLEKAEDIAADLIVIGSRGHSELAGLLLGSVSHRVCQHAKCTCLVVR